MNIEEARLYLEHTSKDDFNLEEHQKENRYQAIQVVLKEIERLHSIIKEQNKELELERKSRQLLTDDLANVCEISLKKENIIKEVREYINKIPTQPVIRVFKKELLELLDKANKEE